MKAAILIGVMVLTTPAIAEEMSVSQCIMLSNGISALRYVGAQLNDPRPIPAEAKQYKFDGATLWKLARAQQRLIVIFEGYRTTYAQIVAARTADSKGAADVGADGLTPALRAAANAEAQKVLDQPCQADIPHVKQSELRLKENAYPPDVLAALSYMVDEDMPSADPPK